MRIVIFLCFLCCNCSLAQFISLENDFDAYSSISCSKQVSDKSIKQRVVFTNPALLDSFSYKNLNLTYSRFLNSNNFNVAYHYQKKRKFNSAIFINSFAFNNLPELNEFGEKLGTYNIGMYQAGHLCSISQGNYKIGITNRLKVNNLAGQISFASYLDFGVQFVHPIKDLKIGFSFNSIDLSINNNQYINWSEPLSVNLGFSFKPKYMPIRIHSGFGSNYIKNKTYVQYSMLNSQFLNFAFLQPDFLIHKNLLLTAGLFINKNTKYNVEKSISIGAVFQKENYGFGFTARKDLRLYNYLIFSSYIAIK